MIFVAQYSVTLEKGNIEEIAELIDNAVLDGVTPEKRASVVKTMNNVNIIFNVYDKTVWYMRGLISLSVLIADDGSKISIDAVSSGGRNFFNDYTPAENKFIEIVKRVVEEYMQTNDNCVQFCYT